MTFPAITAFYAALLALIYIAMSFWVVGGRVTGNVLHGDGGDKALLKRVRSHGNFAEYVPFAILLVALLESSGGNRTFVRVLMIVLLIARILHPIGMFASVNSPRQFTCRGGGVIATLIVIGVAAIALLIRTA